MREFEYVLHSAGGEAPAAWIGPEAARSALRFHSGIPGYAPTPLQELPGLAKRLGLGKVWVKDESKRFGLNAFKALGGSYAVAEVLCQRLGIPLDEHACARLTAPEARGKLGEITFVTATDGNHGRGVAWAAGMFGQSSVVYLPKGSAPERLRNIRNLGARAEIVPVNYDDAVRLAAKRAEENGWILVQDTSWPGYEDVPRSIMRGYAAMPAEIAGQLAGERPTHLLLQAGVGSMAGAVAGCFASLWGKARPFTIVVEPAAANCLFLTAKAGDGRLHSVPGDMNSMMAGLCCGEPCPLGWAILEQCADAFAACSDEYAAEGMRMLARPAPGDAAIVSGESGAVTAGALAGLMMQPELADARRAFGLDANSRVLLISTEGDTDRENYRRIVERGEMGKQMIEVVAAIIRDGDRALLCRRPEGKSQGGKWEFPGGKIEPGESGEKALFREIVEELGMELEVGEALADVTQDYPDRAVHLTLYDCRIAKGAPQRLEHSEIRWTPIEEISSYDLCPADRKLVEQLRGREKK